MVNYNNKKKNIVLEKIKKFFSVIGFCFCFLCHSKYDDDDENYKENELREPMAKIRLGFKGKDTWINSEGINIHQMFGKYSVLLDDDDQIVPLTKDGELFEPLDCRKCYKVVANLYGTSGEPQKWKELKKKEINERKQFNLFKKQFKTSQQQKQKEQLNQFYSNNNNNNNDNLNGDIKSDQYNNQNNSILDNGQVDIFINEGSNSLINNSDNSLNNNIDNNNNNSYDKSYSFVEFVNNNNNIDNNIDNNNLINNIKKDFNVDNKFYT
ncbi:hypothetical protein DICPUDRAFT_156404 [Dictyostelium purpureum]|uniref:Uncharacterized protein n=1 Tax=Dictyostelium purpureum TaxID=5786 RepID=F0ZWH3_DICPU|nr:uncharacterized protein DICPUDRAFT_156404 [Dictyostelium purpureum]EGC31698.1 hypothetical protein DICPUDRAFT_156404 [Dictyostelium purpureum]|eukprot:XP_003291764.1 hypothetical protein DICPUDRAFT_156404 [Dictyostelium purpureum]